MAEPLVSVILPTRNRVQLLRRAVASVLAQTYAPLELIVVNDASSDGTLTYLDALVDPRVRILHRTANSGAAAARNAGIGIARGELVAFLDDDDYWLVSKLDQQVHALQVAPAGTDWCLSGYLNIEPNRVRYFGGDFYWNELDYRRGIGEGGPEWWLIATPGWLVRRNALDQAGLFDERIRSWDDWELGLRLSSITQRVFVDFPLYMQDHIRGSGLMRAEQVRATDLRIIMEKHGTLWAARKEVLARHWYTIGRIESLYLPAPAGRKELLRSLQLRPMRLKTILALLMSYLPQSQTLALTKQIRALKSWICLNA